VVLAGALFVAVFLVTVFFVAVVVAATFEAAAFAAPFGAGVCAVVLGVVVFALVFVVRDGAKVLGPFVSGDRGDRTGRSCELRSFGVCSGTRTSTAAAWRLGVRGLIR